MQNDLPPLPASHPCGLDRQRGRESQRQAQTARGKGPRAQSKGKTAYSPNRESSHSHRPTRSLISLMILVDLPEPVMWMLMPELRFSALRSPIFSVMRPPRQKPCSTTSNIAFRLMGLPASVRHCTIVSLARGQVT